MIEYKKPVILTELTDNDIKHPPISCYWNDDYGKAGIKKWQGRSKVSSTRNLLSLLLYYFEIPVSDIANRMNITSSRVRTLIKSNQIKLFGSDYRPSATIIEQHFKYSKKPMSYLINKYEENKPEIGTIFNMLNRLYVYFNTEDRSLYKTTISYLELTKGSVNYNNYLDPKLINKVR